MKKIILFLFLSLVVATFSSCSNSAKPTSSDSVSSLSSALVNTPEPIKTYEWEKQYEKAEFQKLNSPASENGLDGTLICLEGKIESLLAEYETSNAYQFLDSAGNKWVVGSATTLDTSEPIKIYGSYLGTSQKHNETPTLFLLRYIENDEVINISVEDFELYKKYEEISPTHVDKIKLLDAESGIVYYNAYLDKYFDWDSETDDEKLQLAKEVIAECEKRQSLQEIELPMRIIAFKDDGSNAFAWNGNDEIKLYREGRLDSTLYF